MAIQVIGTMAEYSGHCSITNYDYEADWYFWKNIGEDDFRMSAQKDGSYLYI